MKYLTQCKAESFGLSTQQQVYSCDFHFVEGLLLHRNKGISPNPTEYFISCLSWLGRRTVGWKQSVNSVCMHVVSLYLSLLLHNKLNFWLYITAMHLFWCTYILHVFVEVITICLTLSVLCLYVSSEVCNIIMALWKKPVWLSVSVDKLSVRKHCH